MILNNLVIEDCINLLHFIKTTKFEPKAVRRNVQPQTASAKIGLGHLKLA